MKARKYVLFSPPEIARWEISALLVEPDAVWLALDHFGEDISTSPGGLIRWDRNDHHIQKYPLEFVIHRIRRSTKDATALVLATRADMRCCWTGRCRDFVHKHLAMAKKSRYG